MTKRTTKADLQKENEELKKALHQRNAEAEAMSRAAPNPSVFTTKMVPVRNFSSVNVNIPYEYGGQNRTLRLETTGLKQTGMLPLEVWLGLERENRLVSQGYIARTDQPITNPNIVDDVDEFVDNLKDDEVTSRLEEIVNKDNLYKVLDHLNKTDAEKRSSKQILIRERVKDRIFELTGVKIVDSDVS